MKRIKLKNMSAKSTSVGEMKIPRRRGKRRKGRNPLGRYPFGSRLNAFLNDQEYFTGLTPEYQQQIRRYCRKAYAQLKALDLPTNPKKIEKQHIKILDAKGDWASENDRKTTLSRFRIFLRWTGFDWKPNLVDLEPTQSPNRRIYTPDELKRKKSHAEHPYERFLDHVEVDYSQRVCSVIRARAGDFDGDLVILRIKGKGGKRIMTAPKHEDTNAIISEVVKVREDVIARCRAKGWKGFPPPNLLLHKYKGRPKAYTVNGLEGMLKRVCARAGVEYKAHHANRRGSGRAIYDQTKDLVVVQSALGIRDMQTTLKYIGIDTDRQKEAQKALKKALL